MTHLLTALGGVTLAWLCVLAGAYVVMRFIAHSANANTALIAQQIASFDRYAES